MFGFTIVTKKQLARIEKDLYKRAHDHAVVDLVELLLKKDKIFVGPITLKGDHQVITDCVFLGVGQEALLIIEKK